MQTSASPNTSSLTIPVGIIQSHVSPSSPGRRAGRAPTSLGVPISPSRRYRAAAIPSLVPIKVCNSPGRSAGVREVVAAGGLVSVGALPKLPKARTVAGPAINHAPVPSLVVDTSCSELSSTTDKIPEKPASLTDFTKDRVPEVAHEAAHTAEDGANFECIDHADATCHSLKPSHGDANALSCASEADAFSEVTAPNSPLSLAWTSGRGTEGGDEDAFDVAESESMDWELL
jgi:hypothetical protein